MNDVTIGIVDRLLLAQDHGAADVGGIGPSATRDVSKHIGNGLTTGPVGSHLHRRAVGLGGLNRISSFIEPSVVLKLDAPGDTGALIDENFLRSKGAALVVVKSIAQTPSARTIRHVGCAIVIGIGLDRNPVPVVLAAAGDSTHVVVDLVHHRSVRRFAFYGLDTGLGSNLPIAEIVSELTDSIGANTDKGGRLGQIPVANRVCVVLVGRYLDHVARTGIVARAPLHPICSRIVGTDPGACEAAHAIVKVPSDRSVGGLLSFEQPLIVVLVAGAMEVDTFGAQRPID